MHSVNGARVRVRVGNNISIFQAIAQVETNNNNTKVGLHGETGKYQLTKQYIDDVNRISRSEYTYMDRLNPRKCRCMMRIYWAHYLKRHGLPYTYQNIARIHNRGPRGWQNPESVKYWCRVKKLLY